MMTIGCNGLELAFSDRGQLAGIFQDGKCITDKRREDFFLQISVNGVCYTDAKDFVFEKAQQAEGRLVIYYRLLNRMRIAVYLEAMDTYIRLHAAFYNGPDDGEKKEVSDIVFCLPAIRYEGIEKDRFHSPGQGACYEVTSENITFTPKSRVADMAGFVPQEDMYSTTPDKGAGLLAVEDDGREMAVGFVTYCDRENFFPMTKVERQGIYLIQKEKLVFELTRFPEMEGGYLYLLPGRGYRQVLEAYQKLLKEETGLRTPKTPAWFFKGAVLEVSMMQLGSFKAAAERIDEFYEIGIRTLYMMPFASFDRPSPYCTMDYLRIDEAYGGEEDFLEFVRKLHEKGMRILLDFVPQGASVNSPLITEHPDWFERDREGNMTASHGWDDTRSFDWANREVQEFFVEVGRHYVKEFDVDGYRIDAPHWKEPNFDRTLPYHASNTCFGSVRMLRKLLAELVKIKPDVALMNEVWGIVYADCTHAVCEYNVHWALYNAALGVFKGRQLQSWLSDYRYTQFENSCKVLFLETHDTRLLTPVSYRIRGAAVTENLMDLAVFMGYVPMIWYEEIPRRRAYYQKLLRVRQELGEALWSWADTDRIFADNENVFVASRQSGGRRMLFLINFGNYPVKTSLKGLGDYFGLREGKRYRTSMVYSEEMRIATGSENQFRRDRVLWESADGFTVQDGDRLVWGLQACTSYWLEIVED